MDKKTILFVDDEVKILKGLRRMLFPLQQEWQMIFAESGQQALDYLEKHSVAVIVSDMRMPGMNGYELLAVVRQQYPEVIRVMLTGQPDKNLYCEVMAISHYFLWKPSRFEDFDRLLKGIKDLDESLHDARLIRLIGGLSSLPSLPEMYTRLTEMLERNESDSSEIAAVVTKDMAMAAQIMKLVNSAFFGLSRKIETLQDAVAYLGADMLRNLVLMQHLFSEMPRTEVEQFKLDDMWRHSFCTANLAKAICSSFCEDPAAANNAYLAGLLHDIGKLIMIQHLPDKYREVQMILDDFGHDEIAAEKDRIGADHAAISGYLSRLWGLPRAISEAVTLHHGRSIDDLSSISPALESLWHANRMCHGDLSQSGKYVEACKGWDKLIEARLA